MIGYIYLNERKMDSNHVRYKIGKTYKNKISFFHTLKDLLKFHCHVECERIFEIKIEEKKYKRTTDLFKIIREIDYSKLVNSNNYYIQLLSAVKNKEEFVLDKLVNSNNYFSIMTVIDAGVHKYLDKLIENDIEITLIIKKYKRKKDIEKFINSKDWELIDKIAELGITKYLNIIKKNAKNEYEKYTIASFGGKIKDIKEYLKIILEKEDINNLLEETYCNILKILKLGYDCILDDFAKYNRFNEAIIEVGRKKDLDRILSKNKNDFFILKDIVNVGFDEHLDKIVQMTNTLDDHIKIYKREKDLEIIKKRNRKKEREI